MWMSCAASILHIPCRERVPRHQVQIAVLVWCKPISRKIAADGCDYTFQEYRSAPESIFGGSSPEADTTGDVNSNMSIRVRSLSRDLTCATAPKRRARSTMPKQGLEIRHWLIQCPLLVPSMGNLIVHDTTTFGPCYGCIS